MKPLQNLQDAIEQAIEGGYELPRRKRTVFYSLKGDVVDGGVRDMKTRQVYDINEPFIDPLFWQALGKARWETNENYRSHRIGSHSDDRGGESDYPCDCDAPIDWIIAARKWFENRMSGGDENAFWQSLP